MSEETKIDGNKESTTRGIITPQAQTVIPKEVKEIKFETDSYKTAKNSNEKEIPKIVSLVMKCFGFKEQKHAEYLLLFFVIVAIGVSVFLLLNTNKPLPKPSPASLEQMKNETIIGNQ